MSTSGQDEVTEARFPCPPAAGRWTKSTNPPLPGRSQRGPGSCSSEAAPAQEHGPGNPAGAPVAPQLGTRQLLPRGSHLQPGEGEPPRYQAEPHSSHRAGGASVPTVENGKAPIPVLTQALRKAVSQQQTNRWPGQEGSSGKTQEGQAVRAHSPRPLEETKPPQAHRPKGALPGLRAEMISMQLEAPP